MEPLPRLVNLATVNTMAHPTKTLFESIITLYDTFALAYHTQYSGFCSRVLIDFERGRFWTWGEVLGFTGNGLVDGDKSDLDLELCQGQLLSIQNALRSPIGGDYKSMSSDQTPAIVPSEVKELHRNLQRWNDTLHSLLSPSCRSRMEELWPHRNILPDSLGQPSIIDVISAPPQPTVIKPRPTAAMKYMGQLRKQCKSSSNGIDLFVEKMVDISSDFGEHSLGWYKAEDSTPKSLVMVEWKSYDNKWTSQAGEELYNRVGEIAELLHQPGRHGRKSLRVLSCTGWMHDIPECRFGFVYEIPAEPVSLYTLITESKNPALGMKFRLAAMMARSLLDVHTIGWIHKNISAHNVIFSPRLGAMVSTTSAYLIGFNHSRLDDEKAFTEGPNYTNRHVEYQHPKYRASDKRAQTRFHQIYDLYSLGLVLLEIGVWKTFNKVAEKKAKLSPYELQQYLINDIVPKLDGYVGVVYRGAVAACLKADFGARCREENAEARKETLAVFESKVVKPLSCCFA